jgi:hypothetical protein
MTVQCVREAERDAARRVGLMMSRPGDRRLTHLLIELLVPPSSLLQSIAQYLQEGEAGYGSFKEPELGMPAQ